MKHDTPNPSPAQPARLVVAAAALLLVPGLYLRFHALDWMEFSGDELSILYDSYRAGHERFALHGIPASIGLPLPNFLLYLLALPVSWTREPVAIVVFVALWNLAGLACVLRILWRCVPPAVALAGTALLASAPGPLLFSRKIWNPDFLFGGMALLLLCVALELERPRRWVTLGIFATGAILCGFHASAWPLVPCVLAWAWLVRVPLERRGLWLGALALLILFAPYAWYFVASEFDDLRAIAGRSAGGAASAEGWCTAFARHARAALETSTAGGLAEGNSGAAWCARVFAWWTAAASVIVVLRTPWIAWRARQGDALPAFDKLLALGAVFGLVLLSAYACTGVGALPHYSAVLIPFPTLAAVWLGWRASARFGQGPFVAACALVVVGHTLVFAGFLDGLQRGSTPEGVHYAPPFAPHAAAWRAEIARLYDEVDSGRAAERAEQARLRQLFEASSEVLSRYDPVRDSPPALAQGRVELHAGPDGLEVRGSSAVDMLRLPEFDLGGRGRAILRLELWSPKDVIGCVFYATHAAPEYSRGRTLELRTRAGENELFLEIPDPEAAGRPMLRHAAARWVLRAAEIRAVGR